MALKGVRHIFAVWKVLIAPHEGLAVETAACSELPLRFGRQPLADPLRISQRIFVSDLDYRMLLSAYDAAAWALGMVPARARLPTPPVQHIVQWNRLRWRGEDRGARLQHFRRRPRIKCGVGLSL